MKAFTTACLARVHCSQAVITKGTDRKRLHSTTTPATYYATSLKTTATRNRRYRVAQLNLYCRIQSSISECNESSQQQEALGHKSEQGNS